MSKSNGENGGDGSYEVGYGKPPKHMQYKPGHSGNPRGRKRATERNLAEMIEAALGMTQKVRLGGKVVNLNQVELGILQAAQRVAKGDLKSLFTLVEYVNRHPYTVEKNRVRNRIDVRFIDAKGNVDEELTKRFNKDADGDERG